MNEYSPNQANRRPQNGPFNSAVYAQKTSALAILSVISGLISFPMMCLVFLSIPFSLFAIVSGHMARGIIRDTRGEYSGMEAATIGMLMGYTSFTLMAGGMLIFSLFLGSSKTVTYTSVDSSAENVLYENAKGQLLGGVSEAIFGASTTGYDALAVARHYVESLHARDELHFQETDNTSPVAPREYRAFVQLNKESAAFLLAVPDYERFTDEAKLTLHESCWQIAQRTLDDDFPAGCQLAVGIYSTSSCEVVMTGDFVREVAANAGLGKTNADESRLADFFEIAEVRPSENSVEQFDSQVQPRGEVDFPAEMELD